MMLAENLLFLRKREKLNQADMLARLGIQNFTWSDYEKGRSVPPIKALLKISDYFRVDIRDLVEVKLSDVQGIEYNEQSNYRKNVQANAQRSVQVNTKKGRAFPQFAENGKVLKEDPGRCELCQEKDQTIADLKRTISVLSTALNYAQQRLEDINTPAKRTG